MSNNKSKDTWEAYCELYNRLEQIKDAKELFENGINCFSMYLGQSNQGYLYNTTYLPEFSEDFWEFLVAFNKKYKTVEELFKIAEKYQNVTLQIDRYWMLKSSEDERYKLNTLTGPNFVCEEKMLVECSVLYNLKRYVFQNNEISILEEESYKKLEKEFEEFLKKYSSKKEKELAE